MPSAANESVTVTLRRDLGLFDVTMIGIGAMIGTSIFVLIGVTTREVGGAVLLVFVLNAIATIFTAGTYAELGSTFPEAGGGYLWAKKGLRHPAAFLSGWMSWFGHTVACSYYALGLGYAMVAFATYFDIDFFGLTNDMIVKLFAVLAIISFVGVNYAGVGATGKAGAMITLIQILIVAFFVAFSVLFALDVSGIYMLKSIGSIFPDDFSRLFMVMGFTFIAFEGYEIIVQCGEEVKDPKRNIPRAIFISVLVAAALYLSVAFACLVNFSPEWLGEQGENAVIASAERVIPYLGAPLVIFGGVLSAMAALNATVFSSSRVSFAMGRDSSLPKIFGAVHKKRRVPHNAIAITGVIMLFMALFFPLEVVVASTSIMFLLLFTFANAASIKLRRRLTKIDIGFKTPLFPLFPVVGIISSLAIAVYMFNFMPMAWYITLIWLGAGLGLSVFAKPAEEFQSIVERKRVPAKPLQKDQIERYRVFLALGDLGDLRLVETAGVIARYFKGELTVNTVVEVPRAMPLEAISRDYVDEIAQGLKKAIKVAPSTVKVRPVVSVSYYVPGAIVDQIKHDAANLLVLGWKGTRRRGRTILGRNLDEVVSRAPCDVAIIKTKRLSKNIEKILLVSGKYYETRKALLLALPLAKEYGASIDILAVITDDKQVELAKGNADRLSKMCTRVNVPHEVHIVRSKSRVDAVLQAAKKCDLLVMGAGAQTAIEKTLFGTVYDRIIRSVDVPVMVLKTTNVNKTLQPGTSVSFPTFMPPGRT
ncbi:MAG: amino acid permease [Methanomassiliicoccus sp.]|nr:MAG: amino acid permease [Methanomassiliicoccus sp.]